MFTPEVIAGCILRDRKTDVSLIGAVILVATYMIGNAQTAMDKRGISTGFGFLTQEAGFAIGESLIAYESENTYIRAYAVAILNTLKVSAVSIIGAAGLYGRILQSLRVPDMISDFVISAIDSDTGRTVQIGSLFRVDGVGDRKQMAFPTC